MNVLTTKDPESGGISGYLIDLGVSLIGGLVTREIAKASGMDTDKATTLGAVAAVGLGVANYAMDDFDLSDTVGGWFESKDSPATEAQKSAATAMMESDDPMKQYLGYSLMRDMDSGTSIKGDLIKAGGQGLLGLYQAQEARDLAEYNSQKQIEQIDYQADRDMTDWSERGQKAADSWREATNPAARVPQPRVVTTKQPQTMAGTRVRSDGTLENTTTRRLDAIERRTYGES